MKKLSNGLTAIVLQRPDSAPVFSFYTNVDAGSVQDPMGKTGLVDMFEHEAFKGTDTIGNEGLCQRESCPAKGGRRQSADLHERDKPVGRDEQKLKQLEQAWQDAIKGRAAECDFLTSSARSSKVMAAKRCERLYQR